MYSKYLYAYIDFKMLHFIKIDYIYFLFKKYTILKGF